MFSVAETVSLISFSALDWTHTPLSKLFMDKINLGQTSTLSTPNPFAILKFLSDIYQNGFISVAVQLW